MDGEGGAHALRRRPPNRVDIGRGVPQRRIGTLRWPQASEGVIEGEVLTVKVNFATRQAHQDDLQRLVEHRACFFGIVLDELRGRAAAQSNLQATAAELVEHADLFQQAHWLV